MKWIIAKHLGIYSLNVNDYLELEKNDLQNIFDARTNSLDSYYKKVSLNLKDKLSIKYTIREIKTIWIILFDNCKDDVKK